MPELPVAQVLPFLLVNMSVNLVISHNLFLTEAERRSFIGGKEVQTVGVSVPVWSVNGISSEPANEVFVKYHLKHGEALLVHHNQEGYTVNIPDGPPKLPRLSDEQYRAMSVEEVERWYEVNEPQPSVNNLKEIREGGSAYLAFRQYSRVQRQKRVTHVLHFVEIKPIEDLLETLA